MSLVKNEQNSTLSKKLSVAQVNVIRELLAGATVKEAAERAGVDRTTVYRWKREDPQFVEELNRTRADARRRVQEAFRELGPAAVTTVRGVPNAPDSSPSIRLNAALAVLQQLNAGAPEPVETVVPAATESARPGRRFRFRLPLRG